jgi:hypothetical protein
MGNRGPLHLHCGSVIRSRDIISVAAHRIGAAIRKPGRSDTDRHPRLGGKSRGGILAALTTAGEYSGV